MEAARTIEAYIRAINAGDVDAIAAAIDEAHMFVDSLGNRIEGRDAMRAGWLSYLRLFPDYRIEVETMLCEGGTVLLCGHASATLHREGRAVAGGGWRIPAAWRGEVERGLVKFWQVYADNKPVHALLGG